MNFRRLRPQKGGNVEEWRPVVGYEGLYEVSNLGRVRSLPKYNSHKTKIMHPTVNKKQGRLSVMLCLDSKSRKRIYVHRLVAMAFVENPRPDIYTEINHKDENPLNNNADNLEWCDRWYNMHYNNLHDRISKPNCKRVVGTAPDGNKIIFPSLKEANKGGYCSRIITDILSGKRKRGNFYKGYFWRVENAN